MFAVSRHKNSERGFTIVELLVAVSLSVLLVGVVTMAFQVASTTIETVQRKLDIYEAARGVMQEMAMAMKPACVDMRGQGFIIKSMAMQDGLEETPEDTAKQGLDYKAKDPLPQYHDIDATKYYFSRREVDAFTYTQTSMGSTGSGMGAEPYAGYRLYSSSLKSERFRHRLPTRLGEWGFAGDEWIDIEEYIVEADGKYFMMPNIQIRTGSAGDWTYFNSAAQFEEFEMRPGREHGGTSAVYGAGRGRGSIEAMDFNVAFWHQGLLKFINLPDWTMASLAPAPNAIKITVSIWDYEHRDFEVFSRIIWLPAGLGALQKDTAGNWALQSIGPGGNHPSANVQEYKWIGWNGAAWVDPDTGDYASADSDWSNAGRGHSDYFNRTKQIIGDTRWDYSTNWNLCNYWNSKPTTW